MGGVRGEDVVFDDLVIGTVGRHDLRTGVVEVVAFDEGFARAVELDGVGVDAAGRSFHEVVEDVGDDPRAVGPVLDAVGQAALELAVGNRDP